MEEQMSLFPEAEDRRPPQSVTWNGWHGCNPCSSGCLHCYMMRRDKEYGKDPTKVHKTANFNLPVRRYRSGEYKGLYKIPSGSTIFTCFTSDFFHPAADEWRAEAWAMMRERSDCNFFMVTKRPERIAAALPADWGETGYDNVYVPIENGHLRIFTPHRVKSYQVQRWRKTTIKYSGVPTFEPSGRRSF